jgi:hypothetical protein
MAKEVQYHELIPVVYNLPGQERFQLRAQPNNKWVIWQDGSIVLNKQGFWEREVSVRSKQLPSYLQRTHYDSLTDAILTFNYWASLGNADNFPFRNEP